MTHPSRSERREGFEVDVRLTLLEDDADTIEHSLQRIEGTANKILWTLGTAAITFGVSAVLLALNLGVKL